jgi:hypothetical protein
MAFTPTIAAERGRTLTAPMISKPRAIFKNPMKQGIFATERASQPRQ